MAIHNAVSMSLHQEGINILIKHMMKQRPSMFNFGTERLITAGDLLCIKPGSDWQTPWLTCIKPLVLFNNFGIDYCYQVSEMTFELYPVTTQPINPNQFLINLSVQIGIGLPDQAKLEPYIFRALNQEQLTNIEMIQVNKLQCFQLDLKVIGHFEFAELIEDGKAVPKVSYVYMVPKIESIELIKVEPPVLSKTFEVYIYASLASSARVMVESIMKCVANGTCNVHLYPENSSNPQIKGNELILTMDAELQPIPVGQTCP